MKNAILFTAFAVLAFLGLSSAAVQNNFTTAITNADTQYVCLPCGNACDNAVHNKPGTCSHCNMQLVNKATVQFKSIAPDALCSFIKDMGKANVLLLDVRTPEEFSGKAKDKFGRLAGAVNIPVQELEKRIAELSKYKQKEIVVYCSHSHRSPMASYLLMQKGFTKVSNMEYGMSEWQNKVKATGCSNKLYVKQ